MQLNMETNMLNNNAIDQLKDDISLLRGAIAKHYPWWTELSSERQYVILEIAFNFGVPALSSNMHFNLMMKALLRGDSKGAACYLHNSKWVKTLTAKKAMRIIDMMKYG